jgi:hypothetical protein
MYFCAWCEKPIERLAGTRIRERAVEHGICRHCLDQKLAELARRVPEPHFGMSHPQAAAHAPAVA